MSGPNRIDDIIRLRQEDFEFADQMQEQMDRFTYGPPGSGREYRDPTDTTPQEQAMDQIGFLRHEQSQPGYQPDTRLTDQGSPEGLVRSLSNGMSTGNMMPETIRQQIIATLNSQNPQQDIRVMLENFRISEHPGVSGALDLVGIDLNRELFDLRNLSGADRAQKERELLLQTLSAMNDYALANHGHNMMPGQHRQIREILEAYLGTPDPARPGGPGSIGLTFDAPRSADQMIDALYGPQDGSAPGSTPEQRRAQLEDVLRRSGAHHANPALTTEVRRRMHRIEMQTQTLEDNIKLLAEEMGVDPKEFKWSDLLYDTSVSQLISNFIGGYSGNTKKHYRISELVTNIYGVFNGSTKQEIGYIQRNFEERNGTSFTAVLDAVLPAGASDEFMRAERAALNLVMERGYDEQAIAKLMRESFSSLISTADTERGGTAAGWVASLGAFGMGWSKIGLAIPAIGAAYYKFGAEDHMNMRLMPLRRLLSGLSSESDMYGGGRAADVLEAFEGLDASSVSAEFRSLARPGSFYDPSTVDTDTRAQNLITALRSGPIPTSGPPAAIEIAVHSRIAAIKEAYAGLDENAAQALTRKINDTIQAQHQAQLDTAKARNITDADDPQLENYPLVRVKRDQNGDPVTEDRGGVTVIALELNPERDNKNLGDLIESTFENHTQHIEPAQRKVGGFDAAAHAKMLLDVLRTIPAFSSEPIAGNPQDTEQREAIRRIIAESTATLTEEQFELFNAAFQAQLQSPPKSYRETLREAVTVSGKDSPFERYLQLALGEDQPWLDPTRIYERPVSPDGRDIFTQIDALATHLNPVNTLWIKAALSQFSASELPGVVPMLANRFGAPTARRFADDFGADISQAASLGMNPWRDAERLRGMSTPSDWYNYLARSYGGDDLGQKFDLLQRVAPEVRTLGLDSNGVMEALRLGMRDPWLQISSLSDILASSDPELSLVEAHVQQLADDSGGLAAQKIALFTRLYEAVQGQSLEQAIRSSKLEDSDKDALSGRLN